MARLRPDRVGAALTLLLVLFTLDLARSEDKCRTGCQGVSPQSFKYAEGTTYKYNFESNIDILLSSAEGQETSTKLKATVLLTQLPQCNQLIRLQDVQVIGPDAKKYSNLAGVDKPIRINFHDGHVEDIICADPSDNQNSLNIKRAAASLFQAALKHNHETDVFGLCPTDINTRKDGNILVIQKTKNLNKCAHRESISNDFLTTTFNLNSEIKSSPLLNGDYSSEQYVKNGILEKALVTENYLFLPFSIGKNGAKASVSTKLQFVGQSKENPNSKVSEPKSIIFDNPHPVNTNKVNLDSILTALKEATQTISLTVGENSASQFLNLIKTLRVSSKNDILAVYRQVRAGAGFTDKNAAKKIFLDALFRVGTGDTVEVAIELLKNKELTPIEQKLLYVRLAFVEHATPGALTAVTSLLDQSYVPREAFLSIGSVGGSFCRQHSCLKVDAINKLSQKLLSKVKGGKPQNREEEKEQIYALKALGNIGFLSDAVAAKVITVAQDKKAPNRIRVAALETLLAEACKDKIRDSALGILKDIQQDSEIRIKAYLVLVQCPNGKVANALKTLLDKEPSYQVGGFIVSHLRNLRATTNPDKELAKQQLSLINTLKRFPIDFGRYSFNTEFSYAMDTLGLASSVESNVIYSQSSFLPRSVSLNLTADLFGHTFNFLELSSRQENLDRVLEHYFGPVGVLRSSKPEELLAKGTNKIKNLVEQFKERYQKIQRKKRDVPRPDVDRIEKEIKIKTNELNKDLDLDYSIKLFGSELLFVNINEDIEKFKPENFIEKIFDALDKGVDSTKRFQESVQSNILFLDTELSYPTSLGFPLRLAIEGASSVQLKVEGSADLRAILSGSSDKTLNLKFIPSANIEIAGSLYVDSQIISNGLTVKSTLYTATGSDLSVEVSKDKGIDVKFSLPVQNQKIVSASHQLLFTSRELGKKESKRPLKFTHNNEFSISYDNLVPYIGISFNAEINSPTQTGKQAPLLPFPFSGNAAFGVGIEREDLSEFHIKSSPYSSSDRNGVDFVFEVLGERKDKKLGVELEAFLTPEAYVRASVKAPEKTISGELRLTNTVSEKSLSAKAQLDSEEYYGRIGVAISGAPNRQTYKPLLDYKLPKNVQVPQGGVDGNIIVEKSGNNVKYTFNKVRLILPNQKSFLLQGNVGREGPSFVTDVTVSDGEKDASLKGKFQFDVNHAIVNAEFRNSVNPQSNVNLKLDFKRSDSEIDTSLQLIHGHDSASKTNRLSLSGHADYKFKDTNDFAVNFDGKFSYPSVGTELEVEFKSTPKSLKYDIDAKYNQVSLGSELDLKVARKVVGDYDLEFEIYGMGNKFEIKSKRDINGDKSNIETEIELNDKKAEVKGTINHHFKPEDIDIGADLVFKVSSRAEPIKFSSALILNPDQIDTSLKISSGSSVDVNIFLKGNKGGNVNGNLKVQIKDYISANGQIKAVRGVGNVNFVAEIPKLNRKLKADSTFRIADPVYNIVINFYPDINRNPQNKFTLSTENKITKSSIDSKNYIEGLGKKLDANVKSSNDGTYDNGSGNLEIEITLPTEHYFLIKYNRDMKLVNEVLNGNSFLSIEQRDNKNIPGRKFTRKAIVKDTNLQKHDFDYTNNYVLDLGQGKNLNVDLFFKHQHNAGDKHISDNRVKVYGSILPSPVEVTASASHKEFVGDYSLSSKYGDKASLNVNGKYDFHGHGQPVSGGITIEIQTPSSQIKTIKFSSSGSGNKPEQAGDYLDIKGQLEFFVDDDGSKPDATVNVKANGEIKVSQKDGQLKGTINIQNEPPLSVGIGYSLSDDKDIKKINGNLEVNSGKGRDVKADLTVSSPKESEYVVDLLLDAPDAKGSKFHFYSKKSSDGKAFNNGGSAEVNNKKYVFTNELVLSDTVPGLDIVVEFPDGKKNQITAKLNRLSSNKASGELRIAFPQKDFVFDASGEAFVESVENFNIKLSVNAPALKINNVAIEAQSKTAKGGNRIVVSATSNGQNYLSGSTSYKNRVEGDKIIIEGAGAFKVKNENKAANFKYIRQRLSTEKDGEQGVQLSFNGGLGSAAVDAELKITNKQFKVLKSYCGERNQCSHIELDSKVIASDVSVFNHEIEIAIDLRSLGFSHEFGLKGVTNRKELVFVHTVDVHFHNKDNKYQYSVYFQPTEAGVSLTTPKRVIALEAKSHVQREKGKALSTKGDISFYFDKKNQPTQKTSLNGELIVNTGNNNGDIRAELKFTNPALGKDLQFLYSSKYDLAALTSSFDLTIDIFARANQKIAVTSKAAIKKASDYSYTSVFVLEAKSQGLKIDAKVDENALIDFSQKKYDYDLQIVYNLDKAKYVSAFQAEANPNHVLVLIRAINVDLVKINSKLQLSKDSQVVDTNAEFLGVKPIVSHLEVKNFNTLKYYVARKESPNDKLEFNTGFIPTQISDFRLEVVKGGARKDLLHASVKLDEANFLKSDYGVNAENIRQFVLAPIRTDAEAFFKQIKSTFDSVTNDLTNHVKLISETAKKSVPNLKPFVEYHKKELDKLRQEFLSDEALKDVEEFLKSIFGTTVKIFNEILIQVSDTSEKIVAILQNQFATVIEVINKDVVPKFKEIAKSLIDAGTNIIEQLTNLFLTYLAKVSQLIDAHQEELKQIATSISAVSQDILRFLAKVFEQARTVIIKESQQIYNEIKALPIAEELKNKYKELTTGVTIPEEIIGTLKNLANTLKDAIGDEKVKYVITSISDYIEKKLKQEKVDDIVAIENIVKAIISAVKSIVATISSGKEIDINTKLIPLSFDFLHNFPRLVGIKFSPFNFVLKNDLLELVPSLRPVITFNPRDFFIPKRLHGVVAQGQHIFTFDGKHLTFPGKCNYLLAGDAVNGNFSLIGTYTNGILTALTLADDKDIVTIKQGRQVQYNNAPADFPVRKENIHAYTLYESVHLVSSAGIEVTCGPELFVCGIHISGFYHGQLKGLLGNGNNEPYDDFTIPNGKIVASESEFGNAFKTDNSCPNIKTVDHAESHHHNEACSKLFAADSSLRFCTPFVDPENYKQACDHGLAAGVPDTVKAIATAYVAACNIKNIFVHMPEEFVKCENADKPYDLYTKFSVKLPGQAADIVVVVDQNKDNEEVYKNFIQPLTIQLANELNSKGINDVQFHLIGYNGDTPEWPSHITNGGKLTFNGKLPNLKFTEPPKKTYPPTGCEKLDHFLELVRNVVYDLSLSTPYNPEAFAFLRALQYPFRPNAVKSIIASRGSPCDQGRFAIIQHLKTLFFETDEIEVNVFTPLPSLKVKDPKQSSNIVGFNSRYVFTTADTKKKQGNADLHKQLTYDDFCSDFAVKQRGNVFSSSNFLASKGAVRKQFVQVAAHTIAQSLTSVERGVDCECRPVTGYSAITQCNSAYIKDLAPTPRKGGLKG